MAALTGVLWIITDYNGFLKAGSIKTLDKQLQKRFWSIIMHNFQFF